MLLCLRKFEATKKVTKCHRFSFYSLSFFNTVKLQIRRGFFTLIFLFENYLLKDLWILFNLNFCVTTRLSETWEIWELWCKNVLFVLEVNWKKFWGFFCKKHCFKNCRFNLKIYKYVFKYFISNFGLMFDHFFFILHWQPFRGQKHKDSMTLTAREQGLKSSKLMKGFKRGPTKIPKFGYVCIHIPSQYL